MESFQPLRRKRDWKTELQKKAPLIHCLTNHITITDCANMILAFGGRPIMAEHPREVEEITRSADALVCNLGNITDERMKSMKLSIKEAERNRQFTLVDLVGVSCSTFRLEFSRELIQTGNVHVVKGNASEILAFCGQDNHGSGVDAGGEDSRTVLREAAALSSRLGCVTVVTGARDLVTDGTVHCRIDNGCRAMAKITGTGCMLGAVLACFGAIEPEGSRLLERMVYAAAAFGICGERAFDSFCLGSGRARLFDEAGQISDEMIRERMRAGRIDVF